MTGSPCDVLTKELFGQWISRNVNDDEPIDSAVRVNVELDPVANLHVSRISVLDRLSKQKDVRLASTVDQHMAEPHIGIESAYCAP